MFGNYNQPYFMQPQMQRTQPMETQFPQYPQNQFNQHNFNKLGTLFGKSVDSIDVVKAMDIPLDGSVSYFPLTDGSAIVTKQLQVDGTSKTVVYKPSSEKEDALKFLTADDLADILDDIKDLKEELKNIKSKSANKGE